MAASSERYRPPAELRTDRLRLRPSAVSDADAIFAAYATDPDVTRFLSWRPHCPVEETTTFLRACDDERENGTDVAYAIEERKGDRLLGMIESRVQTPAVEFAYVLRKDRWGQGIMAEALGALVDHALSHPTIYRAYALCDTENPASARVIQKVGMTYEGTRRRHAVYPNLSPEPRDGLIHAKVR